MFRKAIVGIGIVGVFLLYSHVVKKHNPTIPKPSSLTNSSSSTTTSSGGNNPPSGSTSSTQYKDGTYTGSVADAFYGNVQVSVTISGGKITTVNFLQYPNDRQTSIEINQQAIPFLQQEAIQAQSANVQIVSGATFTSQAFVQSLQAALNQA